MIAIPYKTGINGDKRIFLNINNRYVNNIMPIIPINIKVNCGIAGTNKYSTKILPFIVTTKEMIVIMLPQILKANIWTILLIFINSSLAAP